MHQLNHSLICFAFTENISGSWYSNDSILAVSMYFRDFMAWKKAKLKKEDHVYKMSVSVQHFSFPSSFNVQKLPNGISNWKASLMETNALLAKWIGRLKNNGFKQIVNQISYSRHWHINRSIKNVVRKEKLRVWDSKAYSYFIITLWIPLWSPVSKDKHFCLQDTQDKKFTVRVKFTF